MFNASNAATEFIKKINNENFTIFHSLAQPVKLGIKSLNIRV